MSTPSSRSRGLATALALLLCLLAAPAAAATPYRPVYPDPVTQAWRWRPLPDLRARATQCLTVDREGRVWFGREDGVWRYDGLRWRVYGPEDGLDGTPVFAILAVDDRVVVGTARGVYRIEDDTWHRVFPRTPFPALVTRLAVASDGALWAGTGWGVARITESDAVLHTVETLVPHLASALADIPVVPIPDQVFTARQVAYGALGIQRSEDVVTFVFPGSPADAGGFHAGDIILSRDTGDDTATETFTVLRPGVADTLRIDVILAAGSGSLLEANVFDLCPTRDGALWVSLGDGTVLRHDPGAGSWHRITAEDGPALGGPQRILQTRDGSVWMASDDRTTPLNRYRDGKWSTTRLAELGGIDVSMALMETSDGVLWVGGHEGSLHALRDEQWTIYRSPDLPVPETRIKDFAEGHDGALWLIAQGTRPMRIDYRSTHWSVLEGLNYECEDRDGLAWFLDVDGGAVSSDGASWTRYDTDDGLIDAPVRLLPGPDGRVIAVGSHESTAASARWNGRSWERSLYPALSWGIDARAAITDRAGRVWLGAAVDWFPQRGHRGGVLRIAPGDTTHDASPDVLRYAYGIAESADGRVWLGSYRGLHVFDGHDWTRIESPLAMRLGVNTVAASRGGGLWVAHRTHGAYHLVEDRWINHEVGDGLGDNTVHAIMPADDGTAWVATSRGVSCFDGQVWTPIALPFSTHIGLRGSIRQAADGAVWVNAASEAWHRRAWPQPARPRDRRAGFRTARHRADEAPPETRIVLADLTVGQPGNTTITWEGVDRWHETPVSDLQFAWQLDDQAWSAFSRQTSVILQALPSGPHTFRVKARDGEFNEDPSPAFAEFTVIPPVWKQTWFLVLVSSLLALVALQTARVVRRNRALFTANRELAASNRQLHETREQMILQEKMAALGGLVAGVAHEINTPVGAFNSAGDLMRRCIDRITRLVAESPSVEALRENPEFTRALGSLTASASTATAAGARIAAIVGSLRRFARLDESDYQRADLHEGLDSTLELCETDLGDRITVERDYGDLPRVPCYPGELNQVFMNLVTNAIHAIEGEGRITVRTRREDADVVIAIADTGSGISPEDRPHIFDPGFTTRGVGVGVGLGLSISYRIIQKHGGSIHVDSEPGRGSTFTLRIPLERTPS